MRTTIRLRTDQLFGFQQAIGDKKLFLDFFLKGSLKLHKHHRKVETQIELSVAIDS